MKFTKITISLTVTATEPQTELLTSRLTDLGAEGFELGIDSPTVTVYIPDNAQGRGIVDAITQFLAQQGLEYTTASVAEEDWENNWKQHFKPFEVGRSLVIKPSWEHYDNVNDKIVLQIDPATAFGTGQHATTRLCLELLEKHIAQYCNVLDIGCGSGILSAAAMLFGARSIASVDICENAIRITEETLSMNGIVDYKVYCGNVIGDVRLRKEIGSNYYELVVANITADVIIAMKDVLVEFAGDRLILSGVIGHSLDDVLQAIQPHFDVIERREDEGWHGLVCVKK